MTLQIIAGSTQYPTEGPPPVVTIGNFDGVHLGHQHLLQRTIHHARRLGVPSCVFTFEPSPRTLLAPSLRVPRISPWTEKMRMISEMGIDQIVLERFTKPFSLHQPEWFAKQIIARRLRASGLVVGYDFRFGRARVGTADTMKELLPDLFVEAVNAQQLKGKTVSSSVIRSLISDGEVLAAAKLLGRPHKIQGIVVPGAGRGRKLGFPTANLHPDSELIPANGVYAVMARIDTNNWLPGVANLGIRPTFDGHNRQIEIHIFDFSEDIYGSQLEVLFHKRLRSEFRFSSEQSLNDQIQKDIASARSALVNVDVLSG